MIIIKTVTLFVLLFAMATLTGCQAAEQLEEIEPTLEAELKADLMDEILSTKFNSSTDQYSLRHPAEWVVEEEGEGIVLVMANSEAALERFNIGQTEPGDLAMNIGYIPAAWFETREFGRPDLQLGSTPDAFLRSVMPMLRLSGDYMEGTDLSNSELVSLSDDVDAGLLTVSNAERAGMLIVFEAADGVFAFVTVTGDPGEVDDFQEIAFALAVSIDYTGSADDLAAAFFGN